MSKTHLTKEDRNKIESDLNMGLSLRSIGKELGKSASTISREVQKNAIDSIKSPLYTVHNACVHRFDCQLSLICPNNPDCKKSRCRSCKVCNIVCDQFFEDHCNTLKSPPYVCNGCDNQRKCTLNRRYYVSNDADIQSHRILSESRTGVNLTEAEHIWLDKMISPHIKDGKSIHAFVVDNADSLPVCERSLYNYVNGNLFNARNIDMPRTVRMRPRKKTVVHKVDKSCYIGRTYADWKNYMAEHLTTKHVEGDSVEGIKGGKVLLTLQVVSCDFMFAFLRDHNDSQSVIDCIDLLFNSDPELFRTLFPVILFDRGTEFSNPVAIETASDGTQRTKVFFCNPQSPQEKPHIELNHEFIRRILPKGTSFNNLSQDDINLMMSHINSYIRAGLNNKSPIDIFEYIYGSELLQTLGLFRVPMRDIVLKPALLTKSIATSASMEEKYE